MIALVYLVAIALLIVGVLAIITARRVDNLEAEVMEMKRQRREGIG